MHASSRTGLPKDRGAERLAWFVLGAVLVHGAVLWWLQWPREPESASRAGPTLSVTLEPGESRPAPERRAREAVPPVEDAAPETDTASTPRQEAEPSRETERDPAHPKFTGIDVLRPRQQVAPPEARSHRTYPGPPKRHAIFLDEKALGTGEPPSLLPESIWARTGIQREIRHQEAGGGKLLIRRFDNGEMQVCTRMPDNPLDHWDDSIPLACDRPE